MIKAILAGLFLLGCSSGTSEEILQESDQDLDSSIQESTEVPGSVSINPLKWPKTDYDSEDLMILIDSDEISIPDPIKEVVNPIETF